MLRNLRLGEFGGADEAVPSLDGVDARDDGDGNASSADGLDPADEQVGVVKHLREDEVDTCVNLLLQPLDLLVTFGFREEHVLGEACNSDVEIVAVVLADVADQVDSMDEATLDGFPLILARGRVATQGEDVSTPRLLRILSTCV